MKKRMWALVLAGVLVISQCDTVVLAADAAKTPVVYQATSATPNKTSIDVAGGSVTFTVDGAVKSCVVKEGDTVLEQDKDYMVNDMSERGKYAVIFNENTQTVARTFTVSLDGVETTITQAAKTSAEISSVTEVSSTKLADGKTEYVYNVEGTNLEEVGVVLFRNVNSKFDAGQYSVSREGTGNVQKVTVTIAAWAALSPDEFDEKNGVISGTTCFYPTSSGSQLYYLAAAQKSIEVKKEESSENPDVPQFDATTLNVKVVDKNGNPVSGVASYLKSDQKGYENLKLSVSDDNGKASYKCDNHHEMNDSTYTLLPTDDSGYICDSAIEIEFEQDDDGNSYITTVDSEKFTGQEVVLTVAKAEEPVTVTPDRTKISAGEESVMFTVSKPVEICVVKEGDKVLLEGTDYTVNNLSDTRYIVTFPENTQTVERVYTVILNGVETTITQAAKEAEASKISSVTQVSRTFLDDGRTEYVYNVTGEALEAVGIRVKASINETVKEDKYEVKREGTGTKQIVTITFAPWSQLNILDEKEKELNWEVRFYPNGDRTGSYESADVKLIKEEKPAAADVIESMTVSAKEVDYVNGKTEVTVKGTDLNAENLEVSVESGVTVGEITGTSDELKFTVTFPTNPYTTAKDYKVSVNIRGKEDTKDAIITVKGANTIAGAEALKNPSYILDVRAEDRIAATGKIPGSQACPQFPTDDASLDEKMQAFAERYKDNTDPIYIMCNSGKVGAPRATKNLLAAGIDPARIFTILGGAGDADIQAALVKAPETDALKEAIAKAKEVDSAKYTTESYEAVANALKAAEEVLNKESATQAEVDDAVKALQTAMEGLEEKPEEPVAPVTDNLKAAIAKAKEVDSAKYTTESYKVVENALKAAEKVLDNANATQEDVNAAETALLSAMDGLKVKEETPSEEPVKPGDDKKTDDKKTDDKKTEDKKTGTSDKKSGSPQTGDAANALPFAVAALSSLMAAGVVVKKRKED